MRLAQRLAVETASWSLVDCCGAFGVPHQRRHRADEDVEATVQLLSKLLPLAARQGWNTVELLADATAPRQRPPLDDQRGELSFTIDVNAIFTDWLYDTVGWKPDEETPEDAIRRYSAARWAERRARYAAMTEAHRAAHLAWDNADQSDDSDETWLPIISELKREGCDEIVDAWKAWAGRCDDRGPSGRRQIEAYCGMLSAMLNLNHTARTSIEGPMLSLSHVAGMTVTGLERAITWYAENVDRLASLPPCGECRSANPDITDRGCKAGNPCRRANLGEHLALAIEWQLNSERAKDRLGALLAPHLKLEPDPSPFVRLTADRMRRYLESGRRDEAVLAWREAQDLAASRAALPLVEDQLFVAMNLFERAKDYEVVIESLAPLLVQAETFSRGVRGKLRDALSASLERVGRIDEAIQLWRDGIADRASDSYLAPQAPAQVQWKYERLSLNL